MKMCRNDGNGIYTGHTPGDGLDAAAAAAAAAASAKYV